MAKLILNTAAKTRMVNKFVNVSNDFSHGVLSIYLKRLSEANSLDFNEMNQIDVGASTSYTNDNLTIPGLQDFKRLNLIGNGTKIELSEQHAVSPTVDIGNFSTAGPLVWAIPGMRNTSHVGIGTFDYEVGYLYPHAEISLSSTIPPSANIKTFLISNLSIEFKGDGE